MKASQKQNKQKHLVIGVGQIGQAIKSLLNADSLDVRKDRTSYTKNHYEVVHICFPYSGLFVKAVKKYQKEFSPKIIIIHSTVPVGTSESLNAVHSPCRGLHPNLEKATKVFLKYFGGADSKKAAKYFTQIGIRTKSVKSANDTEALKLWDTTIYGWNIVLEKIIYQYCQKHKLDFNLVYSEANKTYNEGYDKLNRPEYKKYILNHVDGKIGGHCVIPNLELLESEVSKIISEFNQKL